MVSMWTPQILSKSSNKDEDKREKKKEMKMMTKERKSRKGKKKKIYKKTDRNRFLSVFCDQISG